MMVAATLACIATVLIEEMFLRRSKLRFLDGRDRDGEILPPALQMRVETFRRRYRFIRVVQFVAFGLVWALAGEETGGALLVSPLGQITTALLLLQFIRVLGRRVVKSWPLLTVTAAQQTLHALLVILLSTRGGGHDAGGTAETLYGFFITAATVAAAVAGSSSVIYHSRRSPLGLRAFGEEPPPLTASETIARRALIMASILLVSAQLSSMGGLLWFDGSVTIPMAIPAAALLPCLVALLVFRSGRSFHHPAGMALALAPYPLLRVSILLGLTSAGF